MDEIFKKLINSFTTSGEFAKTCDFLEIFLRVNK